MSFRWRFVRKVEAWGHHRWDAVSPQPSKPWTTQRKQLWEENGAGWEESCDIPSVFLPFLCGFPQKGNATASFSFFLTTWRRDGTTDLLRDNASITAQGRQRRSVTWQIWKALLNCMEEQSHHEQNCSKVYAESPPRTDTKTNWLSNALTSAPKSWRCGQQSPKLSCNHSEHLGMFLTCSLTCSGSTHQLRHDKRCVQHVFQIQDFVEKHREQWCRLDYFLFILSYIF